MHSGGCSYKRVALCCAWASTGFSERCPCYSSLGGAPGGFHNTQTFIIIPQVLSLCLEDSQGAECGMIVIYVWEEEPQSFYVELYAVQYTEAYKQLICNGGEILNLSLCVAFSPLPSLHLLFLPLPIPGRLLVWQR